LQEKRKFSRIEKNSIIEFKELDFPIINDGFVSSRIKNISANGLIFPSDKKVEIDTILNLKVKLIGWDKEKDDFFKYDETAISEPLSILGRVVRVVKATKDKSYEIGVEFINVSEDDRDALKKFIMKKLDKN
jgi:c-di-GMP-binding flagellar brake protein YcgR